MKRINHVAFLSLLALSALATGCDGSSSDSDQDDTTDTGSSDAASPTPTPTAAPEVASSSISTLAGGGMVGVQPQGTDYTFSGQTIYVGTDQGEYSGDLRAASKAGLNFPTGVAVDKRGNVYIADILNNRVRRVGTDGVITTVAGTGRAGLTGDHVPAVLAELFWPGGVAVDAGGNLYIADTRNNLVRKVDPLGLITTVAGTGEYGYLGDGGMAIDAELAYPTGIAIDAEGALYIADYYNNVIRRVGSDGMISTVAGTGDQGFSGDGGPADQATLNHPGSITVDAEGNLYLTDNFNDRVRMVDSEGIIRTIAGSGARGFDGDNHRAVDAALHWPSGIAVNQDGTVYFTDTYNHRVRSIDKQGALRTVAGNGRLNGYGLGSFGGDLGPSIGAGLSEPYDVTFDLEGRLYIADAANNRIRVIDSVE